MVNAAGLEPKFTAVTPLKLLPVMMTEVPPFEGPLEGESDVIAGKGSVYVNWSREDVALVPPGLTTVILTEIHGCCPAEIVAC